MADNIPIGDITIDHERFRTDIGVGDKSLDHLTESIREFGILEPILLDHNNELLAGMRRLTAAAILQMKEIPFVYIEATNELTRRRIELEENIMRKDMTWQEEQKAIDEIDNLKREEDPAWTGYHTAQIIGKKKSSVYQAKELVEAMAEHPDIAKSTTLKGALNRLRNIKDLARRKKAIERRTSGQDFASVAQVKCGDALDLIKETADESIDHIITNAPFGIDLTFGGDKPYEDDDVRITDLMRALAPEFYRVLSPTGWLICFFDSRKLQASSHLHRWVDAQGDGIPVDIHRALGLEYWLKEAGFYYNSPLPAVWVKPNKSHGQIGDPSKGLISSWESCLFAAKGEGSRLLRQGLKNHFIFNTPNPSERIHEVQMPIDLCEELLSMVALGGEVVLDPFAGSASVGVACVRRQVHFLGFELDPRRAEFANVRLKEMLYGEEREADWDSNSDNPDGAND